MALGTRSPQPIDVVIIDADPRQRRALAGLIAEGALGRFLPKSYASRAEALAANCGGGAAIMIADLETIGGAGGLSEMARPASPMIATSAVSSLNTAIAAVRAGAIDFLPKPIGAKALFERLETAMEHWRDNPAHGASEQQGDATDFAGFIGRSPAMAAIYEQIRRMAPSRAPVFITGESGTGKEVCAEAIHAHSGPAGRPFVALNCSAIPKELMESEIFGHVKGAFTGAAENRTGAAELADGGTLFLDEIAEMDFGLQAKLLRFVQTGSLRKVGGSELKRVDVRLVAATNRDPFVEVEAGRFRGDLFYRLHVLPIHLPPLKARREDIMLLAGTFLARFAEEEGRAFRGFDGEATALVLGHAWPGNVRELQNVVRRIVVLHDGTEVTRDMLPATLAGAAKTASTSVAPALAAAITPFRDQERRIIEEALFAFGGNTARAAAALEISPSTIYRKQQSWPDRFRG